MPIKKRKSTKDNNNGQDTLNQFGTDTNIIGPNDNEDQDDQDDGDNNNPDHGYDQNDYNGGNGYNNDNNNSNNNHPDHRHNRYDNHHSRNGIGDHLNSNELRIGRNQMQNLKNFLGLPVEQHQEGYVSNEILSIQPNDGAFYHPGPNHENYFDGYGYQSLSPTNDQYYNEDINGR